VAAPVKNQLGISNFHLISSGLVKIPEEQIQELTETAP
jgi:hypothetical protein